MISLKPFDMETISKSVRKTRKVIIVEECMKTGGIGASLSAVINESLFNDLDHEVIRLSSQVRGIIAGWTTWHNEREERACWAILKRMTEHYFIASLHIIYCS